MSVWKAKQPEIGDQIRVGRQYYFHHGIYVGNAEVVHFCAENGDGVNDPMSVKVRKTGLPQFLLGGFLEVREYSLAEKRQRRKPEEIVKTALARLGEGGYDALKNNCEDFSNECAFGKRMPSQVDEFRKKIGELIK
ncbi:MAG TPA: lecithin retinol acyltransferase family protein [Oscillospiraceae bacterium]|nr:lecithin retinol acyltransferase family protein [Oscillospiraceae bacterium]HPF55431.1 lecithin retinol acyltransferase family protein [Clostridiales bacterium]HPK34467.1 lecithin retinol acyltransferase family protein [Oscillospiraceae bacterium]HPR76293.1 lecithin retinol acyltransferase family protein [Oscillospiraceae bacterium]